MDEPKPPATSRALIRQTILVLLFNFAGLGILFAVVYALTMRATP